MGNIPHFTAYNKKTNGANKMTKGELMKNTYSKSELKNIDASLPMEIITELNKNKQDTYFYVMNYNNNVFGTLEDMRKVN
jgi:hypothetical protein